MATPNTPPIDRTELQRRLEAERALSAAPILSPLGQAAIAYARRGWHVFPCQPRAKQPATPHGFKDATTDVRRITRYWQRVPDANVAIATGQTSGVWVLDVDAPDGLASLRALEANHAPLPRTLTQATGGGGLQLFWRWPGPGCVIRNSAGKLGAGLDTRGDGGYIVAPPSIHPAGTEYVWLDDDLDGVADAPDWLIDLLVSSAQPQRMEPTAQRSARGAGRGIGGVLAHLAAQREGNRNSATFWAATRLRDKNIPQRDADALLMPIAVALGLSEVEARRTIQSAYRGRL